MNGITKCFVLVLTLSGLLMSTSTMAETLTEGEEKVLSYGIGNTSFGMKASEIVLALKADGYSLKQELAGNNPSWDRKWLLETGARPDDLVKITVVGKNDIVRSMDVILVAGNRQYESNKMHSILVEHFGDDPCESRGTMYRCHFPNGKRTGLVTLKATMDNRGYSLEFRR